MAGEEGLIDPSAILIPKLSADALEGTASDLVGDGEAISTSGDDIKSNWAGLQEVYSAPETETLFSAVDPVAATGGDIQDALAKVGDALTSFAQEARKTKQRLKELKDEAETFVKSVEGDPNWRADQEKVDRHEALRIDINHQTRNYQNWERVCANDITSIFGGTHFVGRDPKNPQICKPGEQFYGVNYIPENAAMPWGAPQEVDKPFWAEGIDAVKDYGTSWLEGVGVIGKNIVGDRGLVYPFSPEWFDNLPGQLKGGLAFGFSLTGFYDYRTQDGGLLDWSGGSAANAWKELGNAFVPLSESDRPGYVVTQAVLNIGTLGIGVAPKLGKIARMGSDVPSHGGNGPDLTQHIPDPSNPSHPANPAHVPSVQELQDQLDKLEQQTFGEYSPTGAMDVVDDIPMREHAMAGDLDIQANADDADGPDPSLPSDGPENHSPEFERNAAPQGWGDAPSDGVEYRDPGSALFDDHSLNTEPPDLKSPDDDTASGLAAVPEAQRVEFDIENSTRGGDPQMGKPLKYGYTDHLGRYMDKHGNVFVSQPDSAKTLNEYEQIRKMEDDTRRISINTGIDHEVLVRVKNHLFYRVHEVQIAPDQTNAGLFHANGDVSPLWLAAQEGKLDEVAADKFRRKIMHEGVESYLMESGVPYLPSDPSYHDSPGGSNPTPEHHGAHDLSPSVVRTHDTFDHYSRMNKNPPSIEIDDDLSNIDDIADQILQEWNGHGDTTSTRR